MAPAFRSLRDLQLPQENMRKFIPFFPTSSTAFAASALMLVACSDGGETSTSTGGGPAIGTNTGGSFETGSGGAAATGGETASGGDMAGTGGEAAGTGGDAQATGGMPATDPLTLASGLNELLLDRPCESSTSLPLGNGATCLLDGDLHVETDLTFGGEAGTNYLVTLRVRGIWEPTKIVGGTTPTPNVPLMVGGDVEPGASDSSAINYQQFSIEVASPVEKYWLNNHGYVAHDIHKEDYEMTMTVEGGTSVKVIANDGNDRQIANFPQESFSDLPPYDQTPTLGQFLRLDVVKVELAE